MDFEILNEQILLLATVLGAVASIPVLVEFFIDVRKKRQQVALSLDDMPVGDIRADVAGLDSLLQSIADLTDRARDPVAYESLKLGNEILILGPPQSGKKTLAHRIAKDAYMDRVITVYNARNADALVRAKDLVRRARHQKILLLLPRVDLSFAKEDEEIVSELDALIETSSEMTNVLVVGTAVYFEPDSPIDNLFGIKLVLPGFNVASNDQGPARPPEVTRMLSQVADFYLQRSVESGYSLNGMTAIEARNRILQSANNPAEIEDIVVICQTSAIHHARARGTQERLISPEILERAIQRVIVNVVSNRLSKSAA